MSKVIKLKTADSLDVLTHGLKWNIDVLTDNLKEIANRIEHAAFNLGMLTNMTERLKREMEILKENKDE